MLQIGDFMPTARRVVVDALGVQPGEQVAIITDLAQPATVTTALMSCLRYQGAEVTVVTMSPRDQGGIDPPPPVEGAIKSTPYRFHFAPADRLAKWGRSSPRWRVACWCSFLRQTSASNDNRNDEVWKLNFSIQALPVFSPEGPFHDFPLKVLGKVTYKLH